MARPPQHPSPLPQRGRFGDPRPPGLPALPPGPMPSHHGLNPLKRWRWVGCFGPELIVCAAEVWVGRLTRRFWVLLDRREGRLIEATRASNLELATGGLRLRDHAVQVQLSYSEVAGIETVTAAGGAYAWTRKQAGAPAQGRAMIAGRPLAFSGAIIVDDSWGYLPRHTRWRWCAGVGRARDGADLAWNLVEGVHDSPTHSERTLWVDGVPRELAPVPIAADLSAAGELVLAPEASRTHRENRLIVASELCQRLGGFCGAVGGVELAEGTGILESHDALW